MYYTVFYVQGCSPQTKEFKTLKEAEQFIKRFQKKYKSTDPYSDNWIDHLVKGRIIETYSFSQSSEAAGA